MTSHCIYFTIIPLLSMPTQGFQMNFKPLKNNFKPLK